MRWITISITYFIAIFTSFLLFIEMIILWLPIFKNTFIFIKNSMLLTEKIWVITYVWTVYRSGLNNLASWCITWWINVRTSIIVKVSCVYLGDSIRILDKKLTSPVEIGNLDKIDAFGLTYSWSRAFTEESTIVNVETIVVCT